MNLVSVCADFIKWISDCLINRLRNARFLFLLCIAGLLATGCASDLLNDVKEKGIVGYSYESRIPAADHSVQPLAVSMRVSELEKDPPKQDLLPASVCLAFIPIASLANPPAVRTNTLMRQDIKPHEVEKILAAEIKKSGIAKEVTVGKGTGDFTVRGRINFVQKAYAHTSGFGILYITILPILFLPVGTVESRCDAHLEVVSPGKKTILAKDYTAQTKHREGLLYDNTAETILPAYGKELFPQIVEQFIADMRALPKSAWK